MARPRTPPELDITIDSAKDLKNVNWRNGDLRPYAVLYIDPAVKMSTKVDGSGDTDPRWAEKLVLPVTRNLDDAVLTVEIYHDKASDPDKAIVGKATLPLMEIVDEGGFEEAQEYKLKLKRPSGRPQGKVQISARLREQRVPPPSAYPTPYGQPYYRPPAESRDWQGYPAYSPYPAPYGQAPPQGYPQPYGAPAPNYAPYGAPQPSYGAPANSAYGQPPPYYQGSGSSGYGVQPTGQDLPKKPNKFGGMGAGLAVGALAGAVGGLALGEYVQHEEKEAAETQAEEDEDRFAAEECARDDYGGDDYYGDDY